MIKDIKITPLKILSDNRGKVMHMLRKDDPIFQKFGEIYFSTINHNAIKGAKEAPTIPAKLKESDAPVYLTLVGYNSDNIVPKGPQVNPMRAIPIESVISILFASLAPKSGVKKKPKITIISEAIISITLRP